MQKWLRIMLLAVCTAIGVAVALGVGLNKPTAAPKPAAAKSGTAVPIGIDQPVLPPQAILGAPTVSAAPVIAPYRDSVARQMGQLEETLQVLEESSHRRERSMLRAIAAIQERIDEPLPKAGPPIAQEAPAPPLPDGEQPQAADAAADVPQAARKSGESHADIRRSEGDDGLTLNIQNTDIRAVLEMISHYTGLNIVASRKVTGNVTANLNGVDFETALAAILKST